MATVNSIFDFDSDGFNYYEDIRLAVERKRLEKNKFTIPAHLKLTLEDSIKRGNELLKNYTHDPNMCNVQKPS